LVTAFSAACLISLPHAPRLIAFEEVPSVATAFASNSKSAPGFGAELATAGPRVIPAKFRSEAPSATVPKKRKVVLAHAVTRQRGYDPAGVATLPSISTRHALVPVKLGQPQTNSAVQASTSSRDEVSRPSFVFLVMQTQGVDSSGRIIWNFSVWHLTLFHPVEHQVRNAIAAKST
jgi:hypothetical protein